VKKEKKRTSGIRSKCGRRNLDLNPSKTEGGGLGRPERWRQPIPPHFHPNWKSPEGGKDRLSEFEAKAIQFRATSPVTKDQVKERKTVGPLKSRVYTMLGTSLIRGNPKEQNEGEG